MASTCFFCGKQIWPGKSTNLHHVLPKRYLKGNKNRGNLVVLVHRQCHMLHHKQNDLQTPSFSVFIVWMSLINFGYHVYEQERHNANAAQAIPVGQIPLSAGG